MERVKLVLDTNKAEEDIFEAARPPKKIQKSKLKTITHCSQNNKYGPEYFPGRKIIKLRRACKPSSVMDDHLSIPAVTARA